MSDFRFARGRVALLAVTASIALVSGACTESDDSASGGGGGDAKVTTTEANLDALGATNAATGEKITIGVLSDSGGGTALDSGAKQVEEGAQIATKYVNEYRGGIGGHEVELFVCGTKGTPAGAQDCANQFVEKKVSAVVYPYTGNGAAMKIVAEAGIPVVATTGSSSEELTTPGIFLVTAGFPGNLGAFAQDAKESGIKKFAMITIDVPAATQAAQTLGGMVFGKAGVEFEVVPAAVGSADLTPQVQQAISGGADAIGVTGDAPFCTSFLQAFDTLSPSAAKYVIAVCNDASVIEALPTALDGAKAATITGPGSDDELYAAIVTKYGDKVSTDPLATPALAAGLGSVIDLANALTSYTGDGSAATVLTAMKGATGEVFGSSGMQFHCDGTAIPMLANICSSQFNMVVLNGDGSIKSSKTVDFADLFA